MSKIVPHPQSYIGRIKAARRYCAQMPLSSGDARLLRGTLIQVIDAILLNSGDNDPTEEFVEVKQSGVPMHPVQGNVQMVPTVQHIAPMNAPVVITEAHEQPSHMRPEVIQKPAGASPDVFLSESVPTQSIGLPPGFAALPAGAPVPSTGFVKMVKPGEDPIAAMDDNTNP